MIFEIWVEKTTKNIGSKVYQGIDNDDILQCKHASWCDMIINIYELCPENMSFGQLNARLRNNDMRKTK